MSAFNSTFAVGGVSCSPDSSEMTKNFMFPSKLVLKIPSVSAGFSQAYSLKYNRTIRETPTHKRTSNYYTAILQILIMCASEYLYFKTTL